MKTTYSIWLWDKLCYTAKHLSLMEALDGWLLWSRAGHEPCIRKNYVSMTLPRKPGRKTSGPPGGRVGNTTIRTTPARETAAGKRP